MKDETIGYVFLVLLLAGVFGWLWMRGTGDGPPRRWTGPIPALPLIEELDLDMEKLALGRRLYHDGALSGDGTVSCASCHAMEAGGAEPRRVSFGVGHSLGPINAPTTLNAAGHIAQFWDGRAEDLQAQAAGPVENPLEMATSFPEVVERVEADAWYAARFEDVYPEEGVSLETITDAIAHYETGLVTPGRFDAWVRGDDTALSEEEIAGYRLFVEVGCTSCHQGAAVGGTMFQKMGVVHDYFERRGGELTEADMGRVNHTGEEAHRHFFKVPTLRNVALTAPYFHDGSEPSLAEAVRTMAYVQLGRELDDAQVASIVTFLEALTGELPAHAWVPEDEVPPRRRYAMELATDLRLLKTGVFAEVEVLGRVPDEAALEVFTARQLDVAGVVVDPEAAALPEDFAEVLDGALTGLGQMEHGHVDLAFGEEPAVQVTVVGEVNTGRGSAVAALFETLPSVSAPALFERL